MSIHVHAQRPLLNWPFRNIYVRKIDATCRWKYLKTCPAGIIFVLVFTFWWWIDPIFIPIVCFGSNLEYFWKCKTVLLAKFREYGGNYWKQLHITDEPERQHCLEWHLLFNAGHAIMNNNLAETLPLKLYPTAVDSLHHVSQIFRTILWRKINTVIIHEQNCFNIPRNSSGNSSLCFAHYGFHYYRFSISSSGIYCETSISRFVDIRRTSPSLRVIETCRYMSINDQSKLIYHVYYVWLKS